MVVFTGETFTSVGNEKRFHKFHHTHTLSQLALLLQLCFEIAHSIRKTRTSIIHLESHLLSIRRIIIPRPSLANVNHRLVLFERYQVHLILAPMLESVHSEMG